MKKMFKTLLSILLCLMIILSLTACKKDETAQTGSEEISSGETNIPTGSSSSSTASKEETVSSTPSGSGTTTTTKPGMVTLAQFEKEYRPYTQQRIKEIRAAKSDIKPTGSGRAFYVSNSGKSTNSGLSPSSPLATYEQVKAKGLKSGDVIYFKRGDLWRETIEVSTAGITLAAYGEGKAPRIYNSPENSAQNGRWIKTDAPNVYEYKTRIQEDIGAIIFDDKEYTYKSLYSSADQSNSKSKRYVNSYKNLKEDLQMYHDPKTKKIYVYSEKGNPADRYNSIEIVRLGAAIEIPVDNVTVDGICMKYSCFGISSYNSKTSIVKGLTIRNCEFGWIGGNIQGLAGQATTRYGNGVEIWGAAENFTVENCYFWQIYDAGVTFQYRGTVSNDVKNVKFNNNVFEYCNYSIEYFFTDNDGKVYDFEIMNNLFWYGGEGLGNQRPEHAEAGHIRSGWAKQGNPIKIENNLFAISLRTLARTLDTAGLGGAFNNNTYAQFEKRDFAANGNQDKVFKMNSDIKENVETKLGDKNAKIITISK